MAGATAVTLGLLLALLGCAAAPDPALEEAWEGWKSLHAKEYPGPGDQGHAQGDLGAEPAPHRSAQPGGVAGQAQLLPGHEPLRGPGIFTCPSGKQQLSHAMLLVGYDAAQIRNCNTSYWILKNSWSEGWGEKGYMFLLKDAGNQCGVASDGSYPLP